MASNQESERIDRLLAGGYLSGAEYDAIEQQVLSRTVTARGQPWRGRSAGIVGAFALAALIALWVCAPSLHTPGASPFTPKGEARLTSSGGLDVTCGAAPEHECEVGSTLLFLANSAEASGYFGAYAERVDAATPERIWYFPDAQGTSPRVEHGAGTQVLGRGIRIGAEHAACPYRIVLWLTAEPLTRDEVVHLDPAKFVARNTLTIQVRR